MFKIEFRHYSEALGKATVNVSRIKRTKREAMQHLENMGFTPWGTKTTKLHSIYTNDNGCMAYIMKVGA